MLRSFGLFALVAGAIALIWSGLGKPVPMPPSPLGSGAKLTCISYAPFHGDQAPYRWDLHIPDRQIGEDLKRLAGLTSCVRTYSARGAQGRIAELAPAFGLEVLQGIWLGRDRACHRPRSRPTSKRSRNARAFRSPMRMSGSFGSRRRSLPPPPTS